MIRVEFERQLRRLRTLVVLGILVVFPAAITLVFKVGSTGGQHGGGGFVELARESGLNMAILALDHMGPTVLLGVGAVLAGSVVAEEASWGTLGYMLVRPVARGRLLASKLVVIASLTFLAVALASLVAVLAGLVTFGWQPIETPSGTMLSPDTALARVAIATPYVAWSLTGIMSVAFFVSTRSNSPLICRGHGFRAGGHLRDPGLVFRDGRCPNRLAHPLLERVAGSVRKSGRLGRRGERDCPSSPLCDRVSRNHVLVVPEEGHSHVVRSPALTRRIPTARPHRPYMTDRRLRLFKWLMILIPPITVAAGHVSLEYWVRQVAHTGGQHAENQFVTPLVIVLVTLVALVLAYLFVETLFRVLRRLQADASAQEQDILTLNAVMQERERLSRELHDGAAQLVADLLLRLDTIKELVESGHREEAEAELERLHGVADEIFEDIGESITGLRTNVTERGLIGALQDYVDKLEERHQIRMSLRTDGVADQLSPLAALQVFRLIQEALTNVRKHANAREATVTLISDGPDRLSVVIADDGQGFAPGSQRNGKARPLGLTSMRERVEALGGTFQVNSDLGSGTQVTATIPIPRARRENGRAALATPAG